MSRGFSAEVIELITKRDRRRCLRCGSRNVTIQHRRSIGMGGRAKRMPLLTPADGCLLCWTCNREAEASIQAEAIECGWKIRRHDPREASDIPVLDHLHFTWWLLNTDGTRTQHE